MGGDRDEFLHRGTVEGAFVAQAQLLRSEVKRQAGGRFPVPEDKGVDRQIFRSHAKGDRQHGFAGAVNVSLEGNRSPFLPGERRRRRGERGADRDPRRDLEPGRRPARRLLAGLSFDRSGGLRHHPTGKTEFRRAPDDRVQQEGLEAGERGGPRAEVEIPPPYRYRARKRDPVEDEADRAAGCLVLPFPRGPDRTGDRDRRHVDRPPGRTQFLQSLARERRRREPWEKFLHRKARLPGGEVPTHGFPKMQAAGQARKGGRSHPPMETRGRDAVSFEGDLPAGDRQGVWQTVVLRGQARFRHLNGRANREEAFAQDHPARDGPCRILEPVQLPAEPRVLNDAPDQRLRLSGIRGRQEVRMERRIRLRQAEPDGPFPRPDVPVPRRDPFPNRMPFETVADPATSESVNPTPPTPGRKIVPPRRRADPSSAMRSPRSSAEFPATRAEKRERNPPRTTSSADRTAGTSPARERIADRTGRISVSCPETSSRNRGDVSPTARVPASRRRGDSSSIRETDALRFPPSRRTDPETVAPRRARVLEPRRNSRAEIVPERSARSDRSPSERSVPSTSMRSQNGEAHDSRTRRRPGGNATPAWRFRNDRRGRSPSERSRRPSRMVTVAPGARAASCARREEIVSLISSTENGFPFLPLRDPHPDFRGDREERPDRDPVSKQGERRDVRLETLRRPFRPPGDGKGDLLERQPGAREEDQFRPFEGEPYPRLPLQRRQDTTLHRRDVYDPGREVNEEGKERGEETHRPEDEKKPLPAPYRHFAALPTPISPRRPQRLLRANPVPAIRSRGRPDSPAVS